MKTITIKGPESELMTIDPLVDGQVVITGAESMDASDGYHTFAELYDHRIALFIALARVIANQKLEYVWKSKLHSDGTSYEGWFIMGIGKEKGRQITYHLPVDNFDQWDECSFAETLDRAPDFDGHTPNDVVSRLYQLLQYPV